jgi:hypothetical protein
VVNLVGLKHFILMGLQRFGNVQEGLVFDIARQPGQYPGRGSGVPALLQQVFDSVS